MKTRLSSACAAPGAMSANAAAHAEASRIRRGARVTRAIVVSARRPCCPYVYAVDTARSVAIPSQELPCRLSCQTLRPDYSVGEFCQLIVGRLRWGMDGRAKQAERGWTQKAALIAEVKSLTALLATDFQSASERMLAVQ